VLICRYLTVGIKSRVALVDPRPLMRLLVAVTVVVTVGVAPLAAPAAAAEEPEGAPHHDDPKAAEARAHY